MSQVYWLISAAADIFIIISCSFGAILYVCTSLLDAIYGALINCCWDTFQNNQNN